MPALMLMPNPQDKSSLKFKGKKIDEFLSEFKHYAEHSRLTSTQKCCQVQRYFSTQEKRVLDVLEGYKSLSWPQLKEELRSLYMSSEDQDFYRLKDLQRFVVKD